MIIVDLEEKNILQFKDYLDLDVAELLEREPFRGMVVCDQMNPLAALVWELCRKNGDDKDDEARIVWIRISDQNAVRNLMQSYRQAILRYDIKKSFFELNADKFIQEIATLSEDGFNSVEVEGQSVVVSLREIQKLKVFQNLESPSYIKGLRTLKQRSFRRGLMDCIQNSVNREFSEGLSSIPMEWYDPLVSCYREVDGESKGFLLAHHCPSGRISLELLADWGDDSNQEILHMMRYSLKQALSAYPDDTKVVIPRRDEASMKLAAYFFPDIKGETCIRGTRER